METWSSQIIQYVKAGRQKPLFPVLFELSDDMLDIVFIDQEIVFHDGFRIHPLFCTFQDLLLVMEQDLGVGDNAGRDEGMGNQALRTKHTLNGKPDQNRFKFNNTFVMAITDEASFLPTGTFDHVELELLYGMVVKILRKIIAVFKDNCYHIFVRAQVRSLPVLYGERQDDFGRLRPVFFHWYEIKCTIKGSGIKEFDEIYVTLFGTGALLNLTQIQGIWW